MDWELLGDTVGGVVDSEETLGVLWVHWGATGATGVYWDILVWRSHTDPALHPGGGAVGGLGSFEGALGATGVYWGPLGGTWETLGCTGSYW